MPSYRLAFNVKTDRQQAMQALVVLFDHGEALNLNITGMGVSNQGVFTITVQNAIPADRLAHLNLQ